MLSLDLGSEAEREISPVLAVYQERLGPLHPHTLVCLLNLASAQRLNGDPRGALRAAESAADGLRDVVGKDHPYTLAAMMSRAVLLAEHGDLAAAEQLETEAAEGLLLALGPDHPDVLRCRANLLLTQQERGRPGAAAERNQVITQLAALVGLDHPHIAALQGERRLVRTLDPQPF